jgi:hypothetical protein
VPERAASPLLSESNEDVAECISQVFINGKFWVISITGRSSRGSLGSGPSQVVSLNNQCVLTEETKHDYAFITNHEMRTFLALPPTTQLPGQAF